MAKTDIQNLNNLILSHDMQKAITAKYKEVLKPEVVEPQRVCSCCQKSKTLQRFHLTRNPFAHNGRIGVCRQCIETLVNFEDLGEAQYFLIMLQYPFVPELWRQAMKEQQPIAFYMTSIILEKYADLESATTHMATIKQETIEEFLLSNGKIANIDDQSREDLRIKWGEHYDLLQCYKLENYYNTMMNDYDIKTHSHKDYLTKIAKTSLAMDQALANGDWTTYKNLSGIFDALMKSANFAEAKTKDTRKDSSYNPFGLLFATVEKEGFIPKFYDEQDKDRDIIDKTIKNLKSWTKNLVQGEINLEDLMESAAKRVLEQEQQELKGNNEYDGISGLEDNVE